MDRHFRRYCFSLAERLGMTVTALLHNLDSSEISEWMAFDLTRSDDWIKAQAKQDEIEKSKQLSEQEKVAAFKRMLKGK